MDEADPEAGDTAEAELARRRLEIIRRSQAEMNDENIERVRNVYQKPGAGEEP